MPGPTGRSARRGTIRPTVPDRRPAEFRAVQRRFGFLADAWYLPHIEAEQKLGFLPGKNYKMPFGLA